MCCEISACIPLLGASWLRINGGGPHRECCPGLAHVLGGSCTGGFFKVPFLEIKGIVPLTFFLFIFFSRIWTYTPPKKREGEREGTGDQKKARVIEMN